MTPQAFAGRYRTIPHILSGVLAHRHIAELEYHLFIVGHKLHITGKYED